MGGGVRKGVEVDLGRVWGVELGWGVEFGLVKGCSLWGGCEGWSWGVRGCEEWNWRGYEGWRCEGWRLHTSNSAPLQHESTHVTCMSHDQPIASTNITPI